MPLTSPTEPGQSDATTTRAPLGSCARTATRHIGAATATTRSGWRPSPTLVTGTSWTDLGSPVGIDLDRRATTRSLLTRFARSPELVCGVCSTRQSVSSFCTNASCGTTFGEYTCLKCPFFDDRTERRYFHCDECGLCRVGGAENFFHCKTCEGCFAKSMEGNHTCVERSLKQNCPVCWEYQFDSVHPNTVLRCGHTIHVHCLQELEANCSGIVPTCPICKKSLGDYSRYWEALDREIEQHEVPEEYRGWTARIACNDCGEETNDLPFNLMALKCGNSSCGSYNTTRLTVLQGNGVELAD